MRNNVKVHEIRFASTPFSRCIIRSGFRCNHQATKFLHDIISAIKSMRFVDRVWKTEKIIVDGKPREIYTDKYQHFLSLSGEQRFICADLRITPNTDIDGTTLCDVIVNRVEVVRDCPPCNINNNSNKFLCPTTSCLKSPPLDQPLCQVCNPS